MVCQIDALQRLRPESNIVEAALANLPKTLDETYERIFCSIPEEARLFVWQVLRWLSTYDAVNHPNRWPWLVNDPAKGMPCPFLFRAIEQTLQGGDSYDAMLVRGYAFGEELLRELSGCLITLTARSASHHVMVAFAHYTVVEFLEPPRVRPGAAAPFALD